MSNTDNDATADPALYPRDIYPLASSQVAHQASWQNGVCDAPPFPSTCPKEYQQNYSHHFDGRQDPIPFDPAKHLALEMPPQIKVLQKDPAGGIRLVPSKNVVERTAELTEDLAYTEPFRVLSEQGVQDFRTIIQQHEPRLAISTPRNPKIIRGLGFGGGDQVNRNGNNFVRALNESPELLQHLSQLANVDLCAHPMTTNYSQINYGEPPKNSTGNEEEEEALPADVWHLDSVDYVLVIMLTTGFEGGELLVSNMDPNDAMQHVKTNTLPKELTSQIRYPAPGYGVFMQGSRIAHAVAPLTNHGMARITAVGSYASRNMARSDRASLYGALAQNHTPQVYNPDYLRHVAWRCRGKLEYLMQHPSYDSEQQGQEILDVVIRELQLARQLMSGELSVEAPIRNEIGSALRVGAFESTTTTTKQQM